MLTAEEQVLKTCRNLQIFLLPYYVDFYEYVPAARIFVYKYLVPVLKLSSSFYSNVIWTNCHCKNYPNSLDKRHWQLAPGWPTLLPAPSCRCGWLIVTFIVFLILLLLILDLCLFQYSSLLFYLCLPLFNPLPGTRGSEQEQSTEKASSADNASSTQKVSSAQKARCVHTADVPRTAKKLAAILTINTKRSNIGY